jgi:hypothetical protein
VVANAHGFIVRHLVEPSNEIAGLTPALAQHDAIFGSAAGPIARRRLRQ